MSSVFRHFRHFFYIKHTYRASLAVTVIMTPPLPRQQDAWFPPLVKYGLRSQVRVKSQASSLRFQVSGLRSQASGLRCLISTSQKWPTHYRQRVLLNEQAYVLQPTYADSERFKGVWSVVGWLEKGDSDRDCISTLTRSTYSFIYSTNFCWGEARKNSSTYLLKWSLCVLRL